MAATLRSIDRRRALLRRMGKRFQTDAPEVFITFLRAQGFVLLARNADSHMIQLRAPHMADGEVHLDDSGLVLGKGDQVLLFLDGLVEWSGGAL